MPAEYYYKYTHIAYKMYNTHINIHNMHCPFQTYLGSGSVIDSSFGDITVDLCAESLIYPGY